MRLVPARRQCAKLGTREDLWRGTTRWQRYVGKIDERACKQEDGNELINVFRMELYLSVPSRIGSKRPLAYLVTHKVFVLEM
jgi:hypothetical protein